MGGQNQATCPPPSSSFPRKTPSSSKSTVNPSSLNPVRFHEVPGRGEVDFHDDQGGLKCAVDSAVFFDAYGKWRPKMAEEMTLVGNDGAGGHASVTLIPYMDDQGEMQVAMSVSPAKMGQTVTDLDKLAHYS